MRDILLVTAFIGLIPFVFVRPWTGVLVWSWISYMNPHLLGWGFTHYLPVAMVFGGLTMGMMLVTDDRKAIPMTRETVILVLLAVLFTAGTPYAWAPDKAWPQWEKVMKILVFTFVTMMLIYGEGRIRALLIVIAISLGFYGVKGGIFSIITHGQYRVWGPTGSFIGGNTSLGLAMLMVLPLIVALSRNAQRRWLQWAGYGAAVLTVSAIVFTYSRGAFLGLAIVLPLMFIRAGKKGLLMLLVIPMLLAAPILAPERLVHRIHTIEHYKQNVSAMERIQAWGVAWNVAVSNPVFGAGFQFSYADPARWLRYAMFIGDWKVNDSRTAHSIYFQMLGEHGFDGLILFILLILFTYRKFSRIRNVAKAAETRHEFADYATALQIGLVGYMVSGAFLSMAYFDLFYAFVAIAVIMERDLVASSIESLPAGGVGRTERLGQRVRG